ncbi:Lipoxygenase, partial [Aureobasidium melanogenum]
MTLTLAQIQIGWISALPIEALLAEIMLDELIEQTIPLPPNDNNIYTYGRIKISGSDASHIVAIAQLPLSNPGKSSTATIANNMRRTFPNLKFGIMVGIAGGVWTQEEDIRLGDVIVGVPDDGGPGVIQYDYGKAIQEREFSPKGSFNRAPDVLRTAAGMLKRKHMRRPGKYVSILENPEVKRHAPHPSVDSLFCPTYLHQGERTCEGCDTAHLRARLLRSDSTPRIHYGAIASGDQVIKDAIMAEKIRRTHNIMCFEMEAAGLDAFPCLVIRGISDYADTHKNDDWHAYAAATAAAYAKELLAVVPVTAVAGLPRTGNAHWNVPRAPNPLFTGRQGLLIDMKKHLVIEPAKNDRPVFVLQGIGGAGKSEAAVRFAMENQDNFWGIFWIDADNEQSVEQGFAEIAKMQTPPLTDITSNGVLRWLANTKESWLLILDNCDDSMMDFAAYMPSRGGSIILTTRLTECKILGTWANLDHLGHETATQLLLRACGYDPVATSSAALNIFGAAEITNPRTGPTASAATSATYTGWYAIPQKGIPVGRAEAISLTRQNFGYGPAVAGGPFFPNGTLGNTLVALDIATFQSETGPQMSDTTSDIVKAESDVNKYNGLQTLQDYTLLYDQEWTATLPQGPAPGILTNYTQDLLFSMERLSFSPYQIRRLNSSKDTLNFQVDDQIATNLTGMTQQQLLTSGRLFYADYRDQAKLTATSNPRYSAAVDAYFYIDPNSGDFLPLAIRTNQGANLTYTPADSPDDWMLAKIMYNVCDLWFAQWEHLARTHEVVQIVYMAAIRSLSDAHPVKAILDRLMFEVFAIQPLAQSVLFAPGGVVNLAFPYTYESAKDYSSNYYFTRSGNFQSGYFLNDLKNRGLLNATTGPQLKSFPYYEDASVIYSAIHTFMTSFVNSYYSSDSVVAADKEIQAWVKECNGPAKVMDFPSAITTTSTLIDVLTHMAHLSSTAHHTVNTDQLMSASSTLPFHAMSLYSPVPTQKGATNLVAFLPPLEQAGEQIAINSLFARNYFAGTNRTLSHMFDEPNMLKQMNANTRNAAATFMNSMNSFSDKVKARTFDSNGLSQGMPFVWKALDPNVAPFGVTV